MVEEARGIALGPGEGQELKSPIGGDLTYLARSERTDNVMTVLEVTASPGEGPPLHVHPRHEETIYVLEGHFRLSLDRQIRDAPVGSFLYVPHDVAHTWQNIGTEEGRLLVSFVPGGMEGFFDALGESTEFDQEAFEAAGARYGSELLGPPLAASDPL